MLNNLVKYIRDLYQTNDFIPLHAPTFNGDESKFVQETLDSTFVSSVGKFVDQFEGQIESYTGTKRAIATVNGTAALHAALYLAGVKQGDLVITQALTFVATCNALHHMGAEPLFIDVSKVSLGLCPKAMDEYLDENALIDDVGNCIHKKTGQYIKAVIPMHTFGHPVELDELVLICHKWNVALVEDAAESLGSFYKGKHTGTFGMSAALSFNGNKIITTGGGGMILCNSERLGVRAKHITTTAKVSHPYEFYHDEAGFNYRMPNLNAALGCAQMRSLSTYIKQKRLLADKYDDFFEGSDFQFVKEPDYATSNYWLNAVICPSFEDREELIRLTNASKVMTRPIWKLMHRLPMYSKCLRGNLDNSIWLEARVVNLPSSPVALG